MKANIQAVVANYTCKLNTNAIAKVAADLPKALAFNEFYNLPIKAICEILKKSSYLFSFSEAKTLIQKIIEVHHEDAASILAYLKMNEITESNSRCLLLLFSGSDIFSALDVEDGGIEIDYQYHFEQYQKKIDELEEQISSLKKPDKPSDDEFLGSVQNNKLEDVKKWLEAYPYLAQINVGGITPIKACSRNGLSKMMSLLLSYKSPVDVQDSHGWTALHETCDFGHLEATKLLLEAGADINKQDNFGRTPLFWAASSGHPDIIKFLLSKGADGSIKNHKGLTPLGSSKDKRTEDAFRERNISDDEDGDQTQEEILATAILENDASTALMLLRSNNQLANTIYSSGVSAIKMASRRGYQTIVQALAAFGADVDRRDFQGWTPLHEAADCGHYDVARTLLRYGASINLQDMNGQTALHWAAKHGHASVCKLLMEHAADPRIKTTEGKTAIDVASNDSCIAALKPNHFCEIFEAVYNNDEAAVRRLIGQYPYLIKAHNSLEATPMKAISRKGNTKMMRLLIELGAEVDYTDLNGWTALHETCDFGHLEATKMLIEKGADINRKDSAGRTPLFWASLRGRAEIVQFLLSKGADPNIINNKGRKPKEVAKDDATLNAFN